MAKRKRKQQKKKEEEVLVDIVEVRDQAQSYIERNQNYLIGAVTGVLLLVGGWFAYQNLIVEPKQQEALAQLYQAEFQLQRDSFALALTNPGGGLPGLADFLDEYGGTKAGNMAHFYSGLSYLHLGQYDAAIADFEDFKAKGRLMPILKSGVLGDAHAEKGELDKALSLYKKAASSGDNDIFTPYYLKKVGMLSENLGDKASALKAYKRIKSEYPTSAYGTDIDKYIIRAGGEV